MKLKEMKHLVELLPQWNGKARASVPNIEKIDLQLKITMIETLQEIKISLDNLIHEVENLSKSRY